MSRYSEDIITASGCRPEEAPLVEGIMRLQYGTLDHLDRRTFRREAMIGLAVVRDDPTLARSNAISFGLLPMPQQVETAGVPAADRERTARERLEDLLTSHWVSWKATPEEIMNDIAAGTGKRVPEEDNLLGRLTDDDLRKLVAHLKLGE